MDIKLRFLPVHPEDPDSVKKLSGLASSIVKEHYDPILGPEQNDYMIERFQSVPAILGQLGHGYKYYLVADSSSECGFIAFYIKKDYLYLSKFYLKKGSRGLGYSHLMLDFLKEKAASAGACRIELNVNRFNDAVYVYEKLGFRRIREEKNDIGHGYYMDDYVYSLDLV
ncbi:MAG: GNAT family N-acetyltransferase [Clostridia bacterium]|nr:GNAT family N-acetyltransferase [Clostridia bacterium]